MPKDAYSLKSQSFRQFVQVVSDDPALQDQCRNVQDLGHLVRLAQAAGVAISARELQLWAHDAVFDAPWWPWAGGGQAQRTAFFSSRL